MVVGLIAAVGNGAAVPLMTFIFGDVINAFGKNSNGNTHGVLTDVSKVVLQFVYLGLGNGVASFLQVACWTITGERQASRIRNLYLQGLLRQDIAYFDKETNTGEIVAKMSSDTQLIQDAMGEKVGLFIQSVSSFFGGFAIALIRGWELALVMLCTIPLIVIFAAIMSTVITKMAVHEQETTSEAAAVAEQTISSMRTVASFTGEELAVKKYKRSLKSAYKSSVIEGLAAGIGLGATYAVIYFGYALGIWFGSKMVLRKGYTGGDVINVIFAIALGSMSLGQASPCTSAFAAGQAAAFKMFDTMTRQPEIDAYSSDGRTLDDIRGDIELRDVCFSYPARPDEQILIRLSISVASGTTVALVGESGCGKSTVISLIERFYDPQSGEVLIDRVNLKEFKLRWIRSKISLVSQEPVLIASTIRDNITYGKDDATIEEVTVAAELANALEFISKLPKGLDTIVGDNGIQLSGGQKQRVAIARAILKDPRILLLDEATSALDVKSEQLVQEALERMMANRTTILVAHRLTTVRNADMIAVMHRGSIVEKGSHAELLQNKNGTYSRLVNLQAVNQDSDRNFPAYIDNLSMADEGQPRPVIRNQSSFGELVSFSESFISSSGDKKPENSKSDETSSQYQEVPLHRLAGINKGEIPVMVIGAAAAIVSGLILPVFGTILASIIRTFYEPPRKLKHDSVFWSLMLVVLGSISAVSIPVRSYFFAVAGSKLIKKIRLMCFHKIVHMEISWFDNPKNSAGVIASRLSADAAAVRGLVGDALALIMQNAATFISGLAISFVSSWQLSLVTLALIPLMGLNGWVQMKLLKGYNTNVKMMYEGASQVVSDAIGSIRTVASFSAEEKVMQLYKRKCEGPKNAGIKQGLISGISFGLSFLLLFSSYAASFHVGAALIEDDKTTYTKVFRVFFVLALVAAGVSESSSLLPDAAKAKSATASVFEILDRKSKIHSGDKSGITLQQVKGNIEFQHVCFKYPTRPDVQILKGLCLTVQSGKTVALVGESGSGKSTVISLLQRFYDPDSGSILLDGIEIQKFQVKWLRQQMGLVSQEPILFNDTIRANIAYGKGEEATESEIVVAAELANAHHFISGLQQGYDTTVGERGIQLSGGQKQRVAIARAIIKEPKILLLDEATSALDAESEKMVQNALDKVMLKKTSVIVAHRLSTIKDADLIVVVKNGIIIEKGKHEDLMTIKDGAYAALVALHT
ncbi:Xenobiotic-transporting ATPase protein, partial [Dioscorea alata]